MVRLLALIVLTGSAVAVAQTPPKKVETDAERFAKWEKDVAAIEKRLQQKPAPESPVVFAGSSSIVRWKLPPSFPGKPVVNVGFGGSQIRDCTNFVPRIITPLKPSTVVFYAGDNDVGSKRTPEQVLADYKAFVTAVHKDSPKAKVLFVSIKPSLSRWAMFDAQTKANALVKQFSSADPRLGYIDVVPRMLGADGKPNPEHFVKDGLHMTDKGYEVWAAVVNKALGW